MIKYVNYDIVFQEFPDEVSLCVNLSLCPHRCPGCHSSYLQTDAGEELTVPRLLSLIEANDGITCVGLMGGDNDPEGVAALAKAIRERFGRSIKVGWYSGCDDFPVYLPMTIFDYVKLGGYRPNRGALDSPTTNQRLYQVNSDGSTTDLTYRFRK